jgi:Ca2+-binding EF-hand superfamily protein
MKSTNEKDKEFMFKATRYVAIGLTLMFSVVIGCSQNADSPSNDTAGNSPAPAEPASSAPKQPSSSDDTATVPATKSETSPENIIDAHIKAVGGTNAIAEIKTIHRTGTLSGEGNFGPISGAVEEIFDLSKDRGYTSMELTGYSRKTGWSGKSGWVSDTQAGVSDMPAEELAYAKHYAGPSPLAAIHAKQGAGALKIGGEKEFNGKEYAVVTVEGSPIEFYVNQKTKLLDGMSIPGNLEMTFENHKAVNGVQFARKSTMKIDAQKLTMIYEYKTTEINGEIDATKFKRPSDRSAPTPGRATAEQIISFMDKNGDGKISKDEASEELRPHFQSIDTNGDGAIDVKEAQVMADYAKTQGAGATQPASPTESAAASGPVTAKQIISSMDKNGDGKISKDEASEDLKLFFGDIDANGDGAIDVKEAQAMAKYANKLHSGSSKPAPAPGHVTAKQIISYLDKNGDGKISKDEASKELNPYFEQIDANKDGVIDAKEAQVMADYANKQQNQ